MCWGVNCGEDGVGKCGGSPHTLLHLPSPLFTFFHTITLTQQHLYPTPLPDTSFHTFPDSPHTHSLRLSTPLSTPFSSSLPHTHLTHPPTPPYTQLPQLFLTLPTLTLHIFFTPFTSTPTLFHTLHTYLIIYSIPKFFTFFIYGQISLVIKSTRNSL